MFRMAVGHSDDIDPAVAIESAIAECRIGLDGAEPRAGLLFAGFDAFDPQLLDAVRSAFPGIELIGSTSAAEMSSVGGYTEDGVTLTLFSSDNVEFTAGVGEHVDQDGPRAARAAVEQALAGTSKPVRAAILFADCLGGQGVLEAAQRLLPADVTIVGGAASGP